MSSCPPPLPLPALKIFVFPRTATGRRELHWWASTLTSPSTAPGPSMRSAQTAQAARPSGEHCWFIENLMRLDEIGFDEIGWDWIWWDWMGLDLMRLDEHWLVGNWNQVEMRLVGKYLISFFLWASWDPMFKMVALFRAKWSNSK